MLSEAELVELRGIVKEVEDEQVDRPEVKRLAREYLVEQEAGRGEGGRVKEIEQELVALAGALPIDGDGAEIAQQLDKMAAEMRRASGQLVVRRLRVRALDGERPAGVTGEVDATIYTPDRTSPIRAVVIKSDDQDADTIEAFRKKFSESFGDTVVVCVGANDSVEFLEIGPDLTVTAEERARMIDYLATGQREGA